MEYKAKRDTSHPSTSLEPPSACYQHVNGGSGVLTRQSERKPNIETPRSQFTLERTGMFILGFIFSALIQYYKMI